MSRAFSCSRLSIAAGTALMLSACLDHPLKPVEYDKSEEAENTVAIAINKDVDVLFVIDNSGSMAEEQALLSQNFASFIGVLEADDVSANYRLGITTTDAGNPRCPSTTPENGTLVLSSCLDRVATNEFKYGTDDFAFACSDYCTKQDKDLMIRPTTTQYDTKPAPRKWIERIEKQSNIGGVASNVEAFQCYGPQGVAGCGFESHLESMYKALAKASDKGSVANYGFLREAAILSIVVISDETDCSYQQDQKDVFVGNKVFWNSPDDPQPTSALCWKAGVECTGSSPYTECHAANYGLDGNVGAADADAVLKPVQTYIDFVKTIEAAKKDIDENQRILVSMIAGVPVGYDKRSTELIYQDALPSDFPNSPNYQDNFGIGPGCVLGDPLDPDSTAVPPVREREFAEAFIDAKANERNLYSICQEDYSGALQSIADKIRDQIKPACMPNCVRDTVPETDTVLEPNCQLYEENFDNTRTPIAKCTEVKGVWTAPAGTTVCFATLTDKGTATPSKIDNMSMECIDKGFNLEFILVRSAAAPAGTTISAACELSENKKRDCPDL
jgi:hypothetical protein